MIFNKLRIVRSLCSWSNRSIQDGFTIAKTRVALVLLSALPFSSHAQSLPNQITVTSLPYVLTDQGGIVVEATTAVTPVPPAVDISPFASLFGGGFSAINSYIPGSTGGVAAAGAIIAVQKITTLRTAAAAAQRNIQQVQHDANTAIDNEEENLEGSTCANVVPNVVGLNGTKTGRITNPTRGRVVSNRIKALRRRHALPMLTAAAGTCELPQEQQAEQAEAELDTLTESQTASQDALEAAEAAADAAEAAAETAEVAAESALEAIEILDAILETCSLF